MPAPCGWTFDDDGHRRVASVAMRVLLAIGCLALIGRPAAIAAQVPPGASGGPGDGQLLVANILIGGTTAALRAVVERKNPLRVLPAGGAGGALWYASKVVGTGRTPAHGVGGLVLGALGSSIVANAGSGKPAFSEFYLPVGMTRLRWQGGNPVPRVSVSVYETIVFMELLARDGLVLDADRSLAAATFVFVSKNHNLVENRRVVSGLTNGSAIVMRDDGSDLSGTLHHELVHVRQHGFVDETIGGPLESWVRSRVPLLAKVPGWIEFDFAGSFLFTAERRALGAHAVLHRAGEDEALAIAK